MLFEEKITKLFKSNFLPIKGGIELTSHCNLKCRHCYLKNDFYAKELSYETVCKIFDQIVRAGCILLHFTGGEPLLRKDFSEIYRYAKSKGLLVKILTNGTLINDKIAKLFRGLPPYLVEVSVYGATKEVYEKITGVKGSYKKCMAGIDLLFRYGVRTEIKTTVTTLNVQEIKKIGQLARAKNFFFKFDPVIRPGIDGSGEVFKYALAPDKVVALDLAQRSLRRQLWQKQFEGSCNKQPGKRKYTCDAGRKSFMIDSCGKLMMCKMYPRTPGYSLISGTFRDGWKILNRKSLENYSSVRECSGCSFFAFCDKCSAILKQKNDQRKYLDYYCQVAKLRAKYFAKSFGKHG
ncbi:MAG: radical SAM protein [Candidatus Omnitrophica bacterium]|nr:radical SAM protein [Candidatus Omnitrophota bacterium]